MNAPLLAEQRGVDVRLIVDDVSDEYRNVITLRGALSDGSQLSVVGHPDRHEADREARRHQRLCARAADREAPHRDALHRPTRHRRDLRAEVRRGEHQHRRHADRAQERRRPGAQHPDASTRRSATSSSTTCRARSRPTCSARSRSPSPDAHGSDPALPQPGAGVAWAAVRLRGRDPGQPAAARRTGRPAVWAETMFSPSGGSRAREGGDGTADGARAAIGLRAAPRGVFDVRRVEGDEALIEFVDDHLTFSCGVGVDAATVRVTTTSCGSTTGAAGSTSRPSASSPVGRARDAAPHAAGARAPCVSRSIRPVRSLR